MGNILSGGLAGAMTTLFVHPLDFSRTRLAVDLGNSMENREFKGLSHCLQKTYKSDGIQGLYRGLNAAVISIFFYRGLYFGIYDSSSLLQSSNRKFVIIQPHS